MLTRFSSILIALAATTAATTAAFADTVDERDVETAARNFRIQTYETYRTDRPVYDERIEAADQALRRFRLAADDVGRTEIQQWFDDAERVEDPALPPVPDIQLAESKPHSPPNRYQRSQQIDRGPQQVDRRPQKRNGYVVTDYRSNPRFNKDRQLKQNQNNESLVDSTGDESAITRALKNPGELFGKIGKSFLRGHQNEQPNAGQPIAGDGTNDGTINEDGFDGNNDVRDDANFTFNNNLVANSNETEATRKTADDEFHNAQDEIITSREGSNGFDELNDRIFQQNLAIEVFVKDLRDGDRQSVDFLSDRVDQLEKLSATQTEIKSKRRLFSEDAQNEFANLDSLEEITTELMTAVNEVSITRSGDRTAEADGTLEIKIGELRMRLSQILAEQSF
jgi:hypothetical protein